MTERDWSTIPRGQFGFIDLLRGPAALLVLYSHYVGIYLASVHQTDWLKEWVNALFVRPLVIVDQFGQLGVMVFFLISGFIITHVARSENVLRFGIRRVFRIYPGYWLIAIIVIVFGITGTGFQLVWLHNWADVARIATITNYLHAPQHLVLGVGWTLQIEVMYYALIACVMPLIRRAPFWAMAVELVFVLAVIANAHSFGDDWYLFAANVAYLPYLLIGQAIYFYWAGGLRGRWALLLGWVCYFAALFGIYRILTSFLEPTQSRILCLVLALGDFRVGAQLWATDRPDARPEIFLGYQLFVVPDPRSVGLRVAHEAASADWLRQRGDARHGRLDCSGCGDTLSRGTPMHAAGSAIVEPSPQTAFGRGAGADLSRCRMFSAGCGTIFFSIRDRWRDPPGWNYPHA